MLKVLQLNIYRIKANIVLIFCILFIEDIPKLNTIVEIYTMYQ